MSDDPRTQEEGESSSGPRDTPAIESAILDMGHVFEVLDHPRRRYLLYALAANDSWTLRELATKLVAWEQGLDESAVHEEMRDRMYVSLYHAHVPKLVDERVIRFDEETETISRGDHATQVFDVLEGAGSSVDSQQEAHANREYSDESNK